MRKETKCETCYNSLYIDIFCDTCGEKLTNHGFLIYEIGKSTNLKLNINSTDYDFCNYRCLLKFIIDEIKKGEANAISI